MAVESSRETGGPPYELSVGASDTDIAPGTNILVGGPSMSGKRRVGLRILADGNTQGEGSIVISTNDGADQIIQDHAEVCGPTDDTAVGVVDCLGHQQNEPNRRENVRLKYARSPRDMTGIGTNFTELLDEFRNDRGLQHNRVMLDSVSTLLMYFDVETVFRFLHVFTGRIDSANAISVCLIDSTAHDTQTVNTLLQLFDATLIVEDSSTGTQPALRFQSAE